jgi:hypothetical protein
MWRVGDGRERFAPGANAHLSDGKTVAKMGHTVVVHAPAPHPSAKCAYEWGTRDLRPELLRYKLTGEVGVLRACWRRSSNRTVER